MAERGKKQGCSANFRERWEQRDQQMKKGRIAWIGEVEKEGRRGIR